MNSPQQNDNVLKLT